jgi:hypothetical protein
VKRPPRHKCKLMHDMGTRGGLQMAIVGGFDVHRAQITFDYLDTDFEYLDTRSRVNNFKSGLKS